MKCFVTFCTVDCEARRKFVQIHFDKTFVFTPDHKRAYSNVRSVVNICHTHITYVRLPRWFAIVIKRVDVFVKANNVSQHFRFTQCKLTLLLPAGIRPIYLLLNVLHRIHENVKFLNVKELSSFSFLIPEGNSHCGEDNSEVVKIHFMKIFFNLLQLHALLICSHSRGKDFQ